MCCCNAVYCNLVDSAVDVVAYGNPVAVVVQGDHLVAVVVVNRLCYWLVRDAGYTLNLLSCLSHLSNLGNLKVTVSHKIFDRCVRNFFFSTE